MIDEDLLIRCMTDATTEVFQTMLDMQVQCRGISEDAKGLDAGLISLVGITGEWGGSGVFCCSPEFAVIICERMLGTSPVLPVPTINDEVLDVVAEVTNMMIGNIKNGLEDTMGPLAISVPTVIHGRNFQFRNTTGLRRTALTFAAAGEQFEVRLSMAPTAGHAQAASRIPILGLAHF